MLPGAVITDGCDAALRGQVRRGWPAAAAGGFLAGRYCGALWGTEERFRRLLDEACACGSASRPPADLGTSRNGRKVQQPTTDGVRRAVSGRPFC